MKRPAHPGLAESLLGLLLVLALVAFASSVIPLAFNNTRSADWDQASYLMVGLRIARGTALTDGNRNPLYPLLLAPIAERDIGYFTHAKWLSLGLGIAGLVVVYFVSRYYVGPVGALLVTLMLAHNIQYQQAASHVDVEVLLTPLFYLAWHSSCRVLAALDSGEKGLTSSAVLAGVWSGLSYLAKGTGLLLIPLFIATLVVLAGSRYLKRREILIFMLTFIVVASPLWLYNWVTYGSPYYNVNTTHYMWNDSWEDNYVHASEELPTALTYLQTHTVTDMWERLIKGLETVPQQWYGALHIYGMPQGITGTAWVVAVLAAVSLAAAGVTSWKTSRTWFLLTLTGILGFALLFAWYHPIDDAPRFVLPWVPVVYLVPLWSLRTLIPPKVRTWLSRGAGALAALVIIITLWHRPLPLNLLRNMSSHDRRAEAEGIAFMAELLKQTDAGESVAIGPTHDLPYWLAFDRRLMHIPYTRPNWPSFQTWLFRNDIRTVVINEEVWNRRRILLSKALAKTDQGLIGQQLPPGWKLNEPAAFPCSTCMFTV
ncbi:MAG: ArnT family glycosyltransferase, partial [Anaerolineae bacterium]